tara:strand:+ start:744 stop:917 length:174 start_codon:yes stop_codon:yes gene_type:complete
MKYKFNRVNKRELNITFTEDELRKLIYIINHAYTIEGKYISKMRDKLSFIRKELNIN